MANQSGPVWGNDPFEDVVVDEFYKTSLVKPKPKKKPEHYKVISISLYNDDLACLDEMVKSLKQSGNRRANRSALIRFALQQLNVSAIPKL